MGRCEGTVVSVHPIGSSGAGACPGDDGGDPRDTPRLFPSSVPHDAEENHTGDGLVGSRAGDEVTERRGPVRGRVG